MSPNKDFSHKNDQRREKRTGPVSDLSKKQREPPKKKIWLPDLMESALCFLPIVFSSQVVLDIEQNQIRICSEIMALSACLQPILPLYQYTTCMCQFKLQAILIRKWLNCCLNRGNSGSKSLGFSPKKSSFIAIHLAAIAILKPKASQALVAVARFHIASCCTHTKHTVNDRITCKE